MGSKINISCFGKKMRMTLDNLLKTQPTRDFSGKVGKNNVRDPVIEKGPQFPLYWVRDHYESRTNFFFYSYI